MLFQICGKAWSWSKRGQLQICGKAWSWSKHGQWVIDVIEFLTNSELDVGLIFVLDDFSVIIK